MACNVERKQTFPVFHTDPELCIVTLAGYRTFVSPCGRKSERGKPCKSCLAGKWGDHDRPTRKGKQQIDKAREAARLAAREAA